MLLVPMTHSPKDGENLLHEFLAFAHDLGHQMPVYKTRIFLALIGGALLVVTFNILRRRHKERQAGGVSQVTYEGKAQ